MTRRWLGPDDGDALNQLLDVFATVFEDEENYSSRRPKPSYLRSLLSHDLFLVRVAEDQGRVVAGLAAYELPKFEQERSEIYLYDLGVLTPYRRQGLARALIRDLQEEAARRGAWTVFVQADTTPDDEAAIALYSQLGTREEVLHFDLPVEKL